VRFTSHCDHDCGADETEAFPEKDLDRTTKGYRELAKISQI
jgi:hypothetical protein